MSDKNWDLTKDFVCIGSGIGGLTGAIVAHDLGLDVLVLEKSRLAGGVTAYSMGEMWVPNNHISIAGGKGDTDEKAKEYMDFLAGGFAEPGYQEVYRSVAPVAFQYLGEKARIPWQLIDQFSDYHYPATPGSLAEGRFLEVAPVPAQELKEWQRKVRVGVTTAWQITHNEIFAWGGGAAFLNWDFGLMAERIETDIRCLGAGLAAALMRAVVIDRKIEFRLSTPVTRLIVEDGRVTGVEATHEGKILRIKANKGVLVATSSYDWDPKMTQTFEGRPVVKSMSPPGADGDNMRLGSDVGAAIFKLPSASGVPVTYGLHIPGETGDEGQEVWRDVLWVSGAPHTLLVNRAGKRIGDESFYRNVIAVSHEWDFEKQEFKNFPIYFICDQNFNNKYPILTYQPGQHLPENVFARADTLTELAEKLGIDPGGVAETVERYNGFCETGIDEDFGRGSKPWSNLQFGDATRNGNPNMGPISKGPFYGAKTEALMAGVPSAGLRFDKSGQIENMRGESVRGAYVAGNAAGYMDVGAGYQSGFANTRGMVWGFVAAYHAAGVALPSQTASMPVAVAP